MNASNAIKGDTAQTLLIEDQVERLGLVGVRAIVRRNLLLFMSVVVIVMLVAILLVFNKQKMYASDAVLILEDRKVTIRTDLRPIANLVVTLGQIETEAEIIRSRDFAQQVVQQLGLDKDPDYNPLLLEPPAEPATAEQNLTATTTKLLKNYAASQHLTALGIGILVYDTDPDRAALIANEIAQTYVDETLLVQQRSALEKIELLQERMDMMLADIAKIEVELSELILANKLDDSNIGNALSAELQSVIARLEFFKEAEASQPEIDKLEKRADQIETLLEKRLAAEQERITLEQNLEDLHSRRAILFQRSSDLSVHVGLMAPTARQISMAQAPLKPALPNRKTLMVGSFASALVIGFIGILLREMLNKKLFVRRSVHPALGLQGALAFPAFPRAARNSISALSDLFAQKLPPDPRAEGAQHIQTVLMGRMAQGNSARMLITASAQSDQSAFVSLCLAISAAKDGLKVLMVDLDPRNDPSIINLLPTHRSQYGLPLLIGNSLLMAQEADEVIDGVEYVRPSADAHIPFDLFGTHNLWSGPGGLRSRYDKIVIHVPPISENAALGRLLPFTDNVVFVVRDQSSDVEQIIRSLEKLRQLNVEPTKIVNFG